MSIWCLGGYICQSIQDFESFLFCDCCGQKCSILLRHFYDAICRVFVLFIFLHESTWNLQKIWGNVEKLQAPLNAVEFAWFCVHFCDSKILDGLMCGIIMISLLNFYQNLYNIISVRNNVTVCTVCYNNHPKSTFGWRHLTD